MSKLSNSQNNKQILTSRSFQEKYSIYSGENKTALDVILSLKNSILQGVLTWIVFCGMYGFLVALANHYGLLSQVNDIKSLPKIALTLNFVLSLLLAFRTNTAHGRFWEGRKQWGAMVNVSRNLVRGIWVKIDEHDARDRMKKRAAALLVPAFAVAMKYHLRRERVNPELGNLMSVTRYRRIKQVDHPPLEIAFWLSDYLQEQYKNNKLSIFQLESLQADVDRMVDILGACERILKTPVPIVYAIVFKILLAVYFVLLPFSLVQGINWWTGPAMVFISLIILSINEIGTEIEEPFGRDPNDLPLDFICNGLVKNIQHLLTLDPDSPYIYKDFYVEDRKVA
ncbi:MAG: bestrophin family ion channel [Prochloraceae cyanobacterium]|nr:bestrophin family ion channel [Prochloraceae cyanobacterium]